MRRGGGTSSAAAAGPTSRRRTVVVVRLVDRAGSSAHSGSRVGVQRTRRANADIRDSASAVGAVGLAPLVERVSLVELVSLVQLVETLVHRPRAQGGERRQQLDRADGVGEQVDRLDLCTSCGAGCPNYAGASRPGRRRWRRAGDHARRGPDAEAGDAVLRRTCGAARTARLSGRRRHLASAALPLTSSVLVRRRRPTCSTRSRRRCPRPRPGAGHAARRGLALRLSRRRCDHRRLVRRTSRAICHEPPGGPGADLHPRTEPRP